MSAKTIASSIVQQFLAPNGNRVVPYFVGAPGCAKTSIAREIGEQLANRLGFPHERIFTINPSLLEAPDIMGLPFKTKDHIEWMPPKMFHDIREGTGPAFLIIDELPDADMSVQNPLCRVILDRVAGGLSLTKDLYIICTGNRTEDRSGANRLSTKLANRMRTIPFSLSIDDWTEWASKNGVDSMLVAFLNWRPDLLCEFDAKRSVNPTPRSWEDVSRIPTSFDEDTFRMHVEGCVGEGAAAEYCAFRRLINKLPNIDNIKNDPKNAPFPSEPDILYALMAKLADTIKGAKDFDTFWEYVKRVPSPEYAVMLVKTVFGKDKSVACAKCFPEVLKQFSALTIASN